MAKPRSLEQIKQSMVNEYKRRCKEQGIELSDDAVRETVERFLNGVAQARQWLHEHPGLTQWPDFTKRMPNKVNRRHTKKFSVAVTSDE